MPELLDPPVSPAPGEPASSPAGTLTAVVHNGFPGVLLRATIAVTSPAVSIVRHAATDPAGTWLPVRSGVVHLEAGQGAAYDVEAEPGKAYTYRIVLSGYEGVDHDVSVNVPGWSGADRTGWLKPLRRPDLALPVWVTPPGDFSRVASGSGAPAGSSKYPVVSWQGRRAVTVPFTFFCGPDEAPALEAALSAGEILWQPKPAVRSRPMYVMPGTLAEQYVGVEQHRRFTVELVEVDRPDDVDVPPVVPGWSWDHYTAGHTLATLAAAYGDQWGVLLAGVQTAWTARS